jgi:hypothetical protein
MEYTREGQKTTISVVASSLEEAQKECYLLAESWRVRLVRPLSVSSKADRWTFEFEITPE